MESLQNQRRGQAVKEFILVKNKSGEGNRLLRVDRIADVEDTEEGAVINYRRLNEDSVFPLKTASTSAEVLAAIEGVQESTLVVHRQGGGRAIFAGPAIAPTAHYSPLCSGDVGKEGVRSPDILLALGILRNQLVMELENQTGFRWWVSTQQLEDSVAFFRCSPEKSTRDFDTKNFCFVALEDESEEALDVMAREMAATVLASWQLRGR
jgi:hypothetical protein